MTIVVIVKFFERLLDFSQQKNGRENSNVRSFLPNLHNKSLYIFLKSSGLDPPDKSDFVSISFSNILERGLSRAGKLFSIKLFETFVAKVEFRLRERTKVMFSLDCSSIPTASLLFAPIVQPFIRSPLTPWKCWVNAFNYRGSPSYRHFGTWKNRVT